MIYFFDNELNMVKVATSKNVISAVHEHELNGLILGTVEADLSYTEAFINDVDYFGYYYKDNYYLHKIKRVEHEHENELVRITGRHIFFEDMLYGDYIRDVRPVNRDALYILNQTISANTRWQTVMTDTSKLHSETYYWVPPMEVLNDLTENVGVEYEPKILFDGQNINGFQLHVANRIGEDTPIRVPFGSRVINLKYEVDYSEIVTALYGHGKGEEVGDGYGRRINFSSVNFNRNGVVSPTGQLYMENPSITAQYGKDDGSPKFGRIIFEDIESASELANATYEAYLEQSRPKMLFEASVVDLGDVGMGDGVLIIRREYDVYFNARIHKLMVDLLGAENADVELGDYAHFKESKVQRKTRENNNQYRRETSSRIQQLKEQFNERFDGEVNQMREDFEQALIDAHAEIQAAEVRMTERINSEREDLDIKIDGEIQEAKEYADQQAQEHAGNVQSNLDTVTGTHQSMLDDLERNVMSIDDFIGADRNVGLGEMLYNERLLFEEKINGINTWHYNLLRGTRFDEPEFVSPSGGSIRTDEDIPYFYYDTTWDSTYVEIGQEMNFQEGIEYTLSFDVQTYRLSSMDLIRIQASPDDEVGANYNIAANGTGTHTQIKWGSQYQRFYVRFTPPRNILGKIRIGAFLTNQPLGSFPFKLRLPYLTEGEGTTWLYHQLDNTQNIEEITRRVTQLEDGREEFITRTQYDFETGEIEGTIRNIRETVDGRENIIQNHEDWITTNGASVLESVDGFQSKAWLADIHNPNLFSFTDVAELSHREKWERWRAPTTGSAYGEFARFRNMSANGHIGAISPNLEIIEGETYTLTWIAFIYDDSLNHFDYCYIMTPDGNAGISTLSNRQKRTLIPTAEGSYGGNPLYKYELTFTAPIGHEEASVMIGATAKTNGTDVAFAFKEPKLELGDRATPYYNAYSMFNQRADSIALQVAGIEGDYIKQSSLEITPDYAQIGSMRIDGDTVGSLLRVSPSGIDAVAEAMRLSGDLYVDGDIEAISLDAIDANFARVQTAVLKSNVIKSTHVDSDVITSDHIRVNQALVDKLVASTAFIDDIKSLSIESIYADLRSVNSEIMDTNILKADWIQGGNALLDKVFANTAMFERMMAKSGFVRTLNTVTIDTDQLTIRRPDGVAWVSNGVPQFDHEVTLVQYMDSEVDWTGQRYRTNSATPQIFSVAYTSHASRYLRFNFSISMDSSQPSASTLMGVRITPGNVPSGRNWQPVWENYAVHRGSGDSYTLIMDLGRPTYQACSFTFEVWWESNSPTQRNLVQIRPMRCWMTG